MSNSYKKHALLINPKARLTELSYACVVRVPKKWDGKCIGQGKSKRQAWKDAAVNLTLSKPEKEIIIP